jgi:hypothetical protein
MTTADDKARTIALIEQTGVVAVIRLDDATALRDVRRGGDWRRHHARGQLSPGRRAPDREFGVKRVAVTLRESRSASENAWSAVLYDGTTGALHQSQRYIVSLDRIGGGTVSRRDSYTASYQGGTATRRCASQWRRAR